MENDTTYTEDQLEGLITKQFDAKGFIITKASNKHYQNRELPENIELIDVQIGYMVETPLRKVKTKITNMRYLTLIIQKK